MPILCLLTNKPVPLSFLVLLQCSLAWSNQALSEYLYLPSLLALKHKKYNYKQFYMFFKFILAFMPSGLFRLFSVYLCYLISLLYLMSYQNLVSCLLTWWKNRIHFITSISRFSCKFIMCVNIYWPLDIQLNTFTVLCHRPVDYFQRPSSCWGERNLSISCM